MRAPHFLALSVLVSVFNLGCYHETWTYHAITDVQVYGSETAIRPGPLTLVPGGAAPASIVPEAPPAKLSDAVLRAKLDARMKAEADMVKLRRDGLGDEHPMVKQNKQAIADLDREIKQMSQQASSRQGAMSAGKPKTVLVISLDHAGPGPISTHLGGDFVDRYTRLLVMILDQPLPKETIWATPENSILLSYTPYTPPERTYVGAEGSVKIVSISPRGEIVADLAVRTRGDVDTEDADFFRLPWEMRGRRTFKPAGMTDPLFKSGALRWGSPSLARPTTQPIATGN